MNIVKNLQNPRIFLCYARKDKAKVEELYQNLSYAGFSPWMDTKDILPGLEWEKTLKKAIRESPFFIFCLSNSSVNRRGIIQKEIKEALDVWREKLEDDIYLIPARLERCNLPDTLMKFQWVDLFEADGFKNLTKALKKGLSNLGFYTSVRLRSKPIENLSEHEVEKMLKQRNFFDKEAHWHGAGIKHNYELIEINTDKVVVDHTTGLVWQQSGSNEGMSFNDAKKYTKKLCDEKYSDYTDWRLPTLEEVASLIESKKYNELHIDSIFSKQQIWLWTCDNESNSYYWYVNFEFGYCFLNRAIEDQCYVRVVRIGDN